MKKNSDFILPALTAYQVSFRGVEFFVMDAMVSRTPIWLMKEFQELPDFSGLDIKNMLDIGANVGMFSFYMKRLYPGLDITAIEPVPQNVRSLYAGCVLNGVNLTVIQGAAVGRENANDSFYFNHTESGCAKLKYHQGEQEINVSRFLLDDAFSRPYDFVKCDIEGAEFDVFDTFTKWDKIGALFIEIHPYPKETEPQKQKNLYESFSAFIKNKMAGKPVWIPHPGGF